MTEFSGSNQSLLMAAFRYLGLIHPSGERTDKLAALLSAEGQQQQTVLRDILREGYRFLFEGFDVSRATADELQKRFAAHGANGETLRKCIKFFLTAARHAGLTISPFVRPLGKRKQLGQMQKRIFGKARGVGGHFAKVGEPESPPAMPKLPEFDQGWPPETQNKWLEAYVQLLKAGGNSGPRD